LFLCHLGSSFVNLPGIGEDVYPAAGKAAVPSVKIIMSEKEA